MNPRSKQLEPETVTVKCVQCGKSRVIHAGTAEAQQQPMCDEDFMPMLAVKARKG